MELIRPILVAGMGRSGSSMITEALAALGVYLGEPGELTQATIRNERGYFENKEAVAINKSIWAKLGGGTMRQPPPNLYEGWQFMPTMHEEAERAGDLIQRLSNACQSRSFALKDPRNSLTWPFWALAAPDLQFVICLRHPREVERSLNWKGKRPGLPVIKLWSLFYKHLEPLLTVQTDPIHATLGPVVVTHYERWLSDPAAEHKRIAALLGLPVDQATGAVVQRNLRHEKAGGARLPAAIRRQYARWCALANHSPAPPGATDRAEFKRRYLKGWRIRFYEETAEIVAKLLHYDGARFFEAGCGTGHFAKCVLQSWARRQWHISEYHGYDLSEANIQWAREQGIRPGVFHVADLYHQAPIKADFDCVVCLQTLEHLHGPALALKRLAGMTRPGGYLVVSVPNGGKLDSPTHLHQWTAVQFATLLDEYGSLQSVEPAAGGRVLLGIVRINGGD